MDRHGWREGNMDTGAHTDFKPKSNAKQNFIMDFLLFSSVKPSKIAVFYSFLSEYNINDNNWVK